MNDTLPCNMLHNYTLLIYNVKSIKEKLIFKIQVYSFYRIFNYIYINFNALSCYSKLR